MMELIIGAALALAAAANKPSGISAQHRPTATPAANNVPRSHGHACRVIQFNEQERRLVGWMNAARAGNQKAFDHLARACTPLISSTARRHGVPAELVDDVVQETLLTLYRSRDSYDADRPFTAWLRTIAQRRAIDLMRVQGRSAARELHAPIAYENHVDPAAQPDDAVELVDRRSLLEVAIASLPTRQREAVEQLAMQEKSLSQAAAATGRTTGALAVNLHRALKTLRARLGAHKKSEYDSFTSQKLVATSRGLSTVASNVEHAVVNAAE